MRTERAKRRAGGLRLAGGFLSGAVLLSASPGAAGDAGPTTAGLPQLPGWTLSADSRSYEPRTLYEHINGASELYLGYDFESLLVAAYEDGRGGSLSVEIYRHGSPVQAFGIYSQERPASGEFLEIGAEGYLEPPALNFLVGDTYVKLSADGLGEGTAAALRSLASALAARLGGERSLPAALAFFPEQGRLPRSERYAGRDFLGYEFLHAAFTADYAVDGARFQLFLIPSESPAESDRKLRLYLRSTGQDEDLAASPSPLQVEDEYNGRLALFRKGRFLGGVLQAVGPAVRDRYLEWLRQAIREAD